MKCLDNYKRNVYNYFTICAFNNDYFYLFQVNAELIAAWTKIRSKYEFYWWKWSHFLKHSEIITKYIITEWTHIYVQILYKIYVDNIQTKNRIEIISLLLELHDKQTHTQTR